LGLRHGGGDGGAREGTRRRECLWLWWQRDPGPAQSNQRPTAITELPGQRFGNGGCTHFDQQPPLSFHFPLRSLSLRRQGFTEGFPSFPGLLQNGLSQNWGFFVKPISQTRVSLQTATPESLYIYVPHLLSCLTTRCGDQLLHHLLKESFFCFCGLIRVHWVKLFFLFVEMTRLFVEEEEGNQ
jgi:hypothetical protein